MSPVRAARAAAEIPGRPDASSAGAHSPGVSTLGPRPHRIFILPTRYGCAFALVLGAMLLGAVNYNNGLAYVLTFLLASVALVSMLHANRNLRGLKLRVSAPKPAFAGSAARFYLSIDNRGQAARHAITVRYRYDPDAADKLDGVHHIDLAADTVARETIEAPAIERGVQPLGDLVFSTRFPFGLFRAWSPLKIGTECLVYPRPDGLETLPASAAAGVRESGLKGAGRDDFAGFRDYVPGDSPRQIHWKAVAREQGLPVKLFSGGDAGELVLRFEDVKATPIEARLSQLCRWVLDADAAGFRYALSLPGDEIPPGDGEAHRHACLRALALFEPGSRP
ncbi:MAG TPA: DUF58 domain-containing protein [Gammaproteobacteria bacterium]|nr:DUF58 domain-containing protein [Gammaproteobacteria bacterium]